MEKNLKHSLAKHAKEFKKILQDMLSFLGDLGDLRERNF